ncbi:MAG: hypothetical protein ABIJ43_03550, partial [Candidatus Beckwithbacteria bacterium]
MKKNCLYLVILISLSLFATRTFFTPDYFDGHDAQSHLIRLWQYDKAIKDGQFPPRWAGDLLAGRGYPVFIFTYQLPYTIAESFHLLGFSLPISIKLTFIISYLASTLAMYVFANQYFKSRLSGFISALLWSWAPFIFVKIFITASLGVVVSYAFIPLVFLFLYRTLNKPNLKSALFLSLFLTAWILSHLGTLIIFSPLLLLFFLFYFNKKALKYLFFSALIAFGLSSWYLIPLLTLAKFTHYKDFVLSQYDFQFVPFMRLLYSKWGTGIPNQSNQPLSQQVGIAQWLAVIFTLINPKGSVLKGRTLLKQSGPFLLSFVLSIFLMLSISKPIWDLPTPLQSVSTPWRFLSLSVFSAAILAGFLVKNIKTHFLKLSVFLLLVILSLYGNRNHLRINEAVNYNQGFFDSYTGVATGWNEHMPIWVKDIPKEFPDNKVEVISGDCAITNLIFKSNLTNFTAD